MVAPVVAVQILITACSGPSPADVTNPDPLPEVDCTLPPGMADVIGDPPTDAVILEPGDGASSIVEHSDPGTAFVFKAGEYLSFSVRPRDGMAFWGEPGAILNGQGREEFAFAGNASSVSIQGFVVKNYIPRPMQGAVGSGHGRNWVIEGNEVHDNLGAGIHLSPNGGFVVIGNYVHHNEQLGIGGNGPDHVVEGNEIAFNNTAGYAWRGQGGHAGGLKLLRTIDLRLGDNFVHDNQGPGIWLDGNNRDALIFGNIIESNTGKGVSYEISQLGKIIGNSITQNHEVGVWISASSDVLVACNEVTANRWGGISANQNDRGPDHHVENVLVVDNQVEIIVPEDPFWGWSGLQVQVDDDSYFTTRGNRWERNSYVLPTEDSDAFKWSGGKMDITRWREWGHDRESTVSVGN